LIRKDTEEVK